MANDSLDFVQRGKSCLARKQFAEAAKICRLGLLANPTQIEGRVVLGTALAALQRWDEVLAEMRVALESHPDSAPAWLLKGEALSGKGDYQQAHTALQRAKELEPSSARAAQLLAEIELARLAGLDGQPAEPTDTRVYPARESHAQDPSIAEVIRRLSSGPSIVEGTGETELPHPFDDEATEVDAQPHLKIRDLQSSTAVTGPPKVELTDLADAEERSTQTFLPMRGGTETSYEAPAPDDYVERPRPRIGALVPPEERTDPSAPLPTVRAEPLGPSPREQALELGDARPPRAPKLTPVETPFGRLPAAVVKPDSGNIELTSDEIMIDPSAPRPRLEPDEEEDTSERARQTDDDAGTRPRMPDPRRPRVSAAVPVAPTPTPSPSPSSLAEPSPVGEPHPYPQAEPVAAPLTPPPVDAEARRAARWRVTWRARFVELTQVVERARLRQQNLGLLVAALIAAVALGVVCGLLVRDWRMRSRVTRRVELARQKLASGSYPGFQAAEALYRQILAERDDRAARATRARLLGQLAFEFGDSLDAAARAINSVGDGADSEDAAQARVYLQLVRGDLPSAARDASALSRRFADASSSYLVGRVELLAERPEAAADALRYAVDHDARDPLLWHALGLAEAGARRDERAQDAYRRALALNPSHVASLIDSALLTARRGGANRDATRATLDLVTQKLAGEASPAQLARASLGVAELELARGDVVAARRALASAVQRRREGDGPLAEDLARAFLRAWQLDEAEREAQRAVAATGRGSARLLAAEVSLRRGQAAAALAALDAAPIAGADALVMRARAALQLDRRDAARLAAEAALRLQPDSIAARVMQARVELADGRVERAQRDLERIERTVKAPEVAAALADVAVAAHAPERARTWLREAVRRDPLQLDAQLQLARLAREVGQIDEADAALQALIAAYPESLAVARERAALALERGETQAARDQFDALAAGGDLDAAVGAARASLALGDAAGAVERARRASAARLDAVEVAARALIAEHRSADAVELLRRVPPSTVRGATLAALMLAHLDLDQPARAADALRNAPPRARNGLELQLARARLQLEHGRDASTQALALDALKRLHAGDGARALRAEGLTLVGRALWEQGAFRAAQRALEEATTLAPKSAPAFYHLALVDEELGRAAEALHALETAVAADAKLADAQMALGRLRVKAGDQRAREAFAAYLELAPAGPYADEARRSLGITPATPTSSPPRKRRRAR